MRAGCDAAGSTANELEAKRLEVMKRRQERELEQMLSFELARKSLQASGDLDGTQCINPSVVSSDSVFCAAEQVTPTEINTTPRVQDKAEAKVKQMEARAEEQRRAKQAADAEWRKQQRLREVQRAQVCAVALATLAGISGVEYLRLHVQRLHATSSTAHGAKPSL